VGYTKPVSYISINSLFRDEEVPEYVIDATLAHEFAHYAHGFHSPLTQKYKFPHKGDVVGKELRQRGLEDMVKDQERWIKDKYRDFLRKHGLL
jgi:predicted metal-dependent hydrolase